MNRIILIATLLALVAASGAPAAGEDLTKLLDERTAVLWYEGEALGDLIIGARARVALIYVDNKLTRAAWDDGGAPEWLKAGTGFFGTGETRKKTLFIIMVKTAKNFTLDHSMITIGDHTLTPKDVLTNKLYVPMGELPPGLTASFTVAIPQGKVKGKTVKFSVDEYSTELSLPKR